MGAVARLAVGHRRVVLRDAELGIQQGVGELDAEAEHVLVATQHARAIRKLVLVDPDVGGIIDLATAAHGEEGKEA